MNKKKLAAGFAAWLEEIGQPSAPFIGLDRTGPIGGDWPTGPMLFAYCTDCATLHLSTLGKVTACECGSTCPNMTVVRITGSR